MKPIQFSSIILLTAICMPAMADRPSMSERNAPAPVAAEPMAAEPVMAEPVVMETTHSGDVLEIQPGETVPVKVLPFPRRGMDMTRVQNELGEPLTISPTVGQPPITTWSYPDRKVYFEGRTVIHAVATN